MTKAQAKSEGRQRGRGDAPNLVRRVPGNGARNVGRDGIAEPIATERNHEVLSRHPLRPFSREVLQFKIVIFDDSNLF